MPIGNDVNPPPRMPILATEWSWIRDTNRTRETDGSVKDTTTGTKYWIYLVKDSGWTVKVAFSELVTDSSPILMTTAMFSELRDAGASRNNDGSYTKGGTTYALIATRQSGGAMHLDHEQI